MQSIVLIIGLAAVFIFGFFVARTFGRFLDENQVMEASEGIDANDDAAGMSETYPVNEVEKQDEK